MVVGVNGQDVDGALRKLKHILAKEGKFMMLKLKTSFMTNAAKAKHKEKQGFNRRRKARIAKNGQVNNND